MKIHFRFVALIFLSLSFGLHANSAVEQLLTNKDRTQEDKEADKRRNPAEFITFLDIKPGMKVLDVFSGTGYYTEIAAAAVGPEGSVDAHNNQAYVTFIGEEKLSERYRDNRLPNVTQINQEANELTLETAKYDRVLLILSFHDLFYIDDKNGWPEIDAPTFMSRLKAAMKEDAVVGIIDHNAVVGAPISTAQTLHRIDGEIIKNKMREWGFSLASESMHLRNVEDNKALPMWDPSVRGKTDRVVYKFKKAG